MKKRPAKAGSADTGVEVELPQSFLTDEPDRYMSFNAMNKTSHKSKRERMRALLKARRREYDGMREGDPLKEEIKHEIGFIYGAWLGYKLISRERKRDTKVRVEGSEVKKRINYSNWEAELRDRDYVLVHGVFDEKGVEEMGAELMSRKDNPDGKDPKRKKRKYGIRLFDDAVYSFILFEGKKAGRCGVTLDGCPMISGFIDGLKEIMEWLPKKYCDVVLLSSVEGTKEGTKDNHPCSKPPIFHRDLDIYELNSRPDMACYPVTIYFGLESGKSLHLFHEPRGGTRGISNIQIKEFKIDPGSVLVWDPARFSHASCPHKPDSLMHPNRVNILLHGVDSLKLGK